MTEHYLRVTRTARYIVLGDVTAVPDEVWFVLHGYGQLARRFARAFEPIALGGRMIVAPEALSRFYADAPSVTSHAAARVGATWMTREDREHEIADYVAYLDALAAHVLAGAGDRVGVHVLGFSQGVATAARWLARGRTRVQRLTLWGGTLPAELGAADEAAAGLERLREVGEIALIGGRRDELVPPSVLEEQGRRLRALGLACRVELFDGVHEMHAETLRALAERPSPHSR